MEGLREGDNREGWPCGRSEYEKWRKKQNHLVIPPEQHAEEYIRQGSTEWWRLKFSTKRRQVVKSKRNLALFKMLVVVAIESLLIVLYILLNSHNNFWSIYCFSCSVDEETKANRCITNEIIIVLLYKNK